MYFAWRAYAEYADGTYVDMLFEPDERGESEQQYALERWLVERDKDCTFYSVDVIIFG